MWKEGGKKTLMGSLRGTDGTGANQDSFSLLFPAPKSFSSAVLHRQCPISSIPLIILNWTSRTCSCWYQRLAAHQEEPSREGTALFLTRMSPARSNFHPRVLHHRCSPTQPRHPATALPRCAIKKTNDNGVAPLASAVQLFASLSIFLYLDVKYRSRCWGWRELAGKAVLAGGQMRVRQDKAGNYGPSLLRMNLNPFIHPPATYRFFQLPLNDFVFF